MASPPERPQHQNLTECARLRESCQRAIFTKMDDQHACQMKVLVEIKEQLAFARGREAALAGCSTNKGGKRDWTAIAIKFLIAWGPMILLLIALGMISWLRNKGWW